LKNVFEIILYQILIMIFTIFKFIILYIYCLPYFKSFIELLNIFFILIYIWTTYVSNNFWIHFYREIRVLILKIILISILTIKYWLQLFGIKFVQLVQIVDIIVTYFIYHLPIYIQLNLKLVLHIDLHRTMLLLLNDNLLNF
jgi:hypothetical protein